MIGSTGVRAHHLSFCAESRREPMIKLRSCVLEESRDEMSRYDAADLSRGLW